MPGQNHETTAEAFFKEGWLTESPPDYVCSAAVLPGRVTSCSDWLARSAHLFDMLYAEVAI